MRSKRLKERYPGAAPSAIPILERLRGIVNTILAEELEPQPERKSKKKGGEKNAPHHQSRKRRAGANH